uniref:F-box domain-containing protein n=1 Tax=Caenorhabditis tropicalis TaxID=1561998 RepID=A0A1I7UU10_9PELO
MTPFPLLRLPLLAIEQVLCMMSPFELIDLSLTSSRGKSIVTNVGPRFEGFMVPGESLSIMVFEVGRRAYTKTSDESKDDEVAYGFEAESEYFKHLEDPIEGWKKWCKYLKEVLRCQFYEVTFDLNNRGMGFREIVDWVKVQQDDFDNMTIESKEECDDDLKYVIETFPTVSELNISVSHYKEGFKMEIPGNLSSLTIRNANFIDNEQFLRLNAQINVFEEHILTNEDIHQFVRGWMSMEAHVGLKTLMLRMENQERFNGMLTGIPFEQITDVEILERHQNRLQGDDMFRITRCDGKRCFVYILCRSYLCMEVC